MVQLKLSDSSKDGIKSSELTTVTSTTPSVVPEVGGVRVRTLQQKRWVGRLPLSFGLRQPAQWSLVSSPLKVVLSSGVKIPFNSPSSSSSSFSSSSLTLILCPSSSRCRGLSIFLFLLLAVSFMATLKKLCDYKELNIRLMQELALERSKESISW